MNTTLRVRLYGVFASRMEEAIAYGYKRAHKHTDTPSSDAVWEEIYNAVMSALCELLDFPEEDIDDDGPGSGETNRL